MSLVLKGRAEQVWEAFSDHGIRNSRDDEFDGDESLPSFCTQNIRLPASQLMFLNLVHLMFRS